MLKLYQQFQNKVLIYEQKLIANLTSTRARNVKYRYLDNHRLHKILVRYAKVLLVVVVALIIAAIYIAIDTWIQAADRSQITSIESSSVQTSSSQIFRSEYFQFQAPNGWVEVSNETKPPTYVYRQLDGNLVKRELRIYVNSPPEQIASSRVLPVSVEDEQLVPGTVSDHCKNSSAFSGGNRNPIEIDWQGIMIYCEPDSIEYNLVVGNRGSKHGMLLKRPDDSYATYTMIYRDLTISPNINDLSGILRSFQAR
jgi:hypothetical protein